MTERCGEHVFAVEVVAHTSEEGDELCIVLVAAHEHLAFFLGIFACAHIVIGETVVGEIFVFIVQALIL